MHPINKHERVRVGVTKGKRRAKFMVGPRSEYLSEEEYLKFKASQEQAHRNHAKVCSCEMCRSPRKSGWSSGKDKLSIQERKYARVME